MEVYSTPKLEYYTGEILFLELYQKPRNMVLLVMNQLDTNNSKLK